MINKENINLKEKQVKELVNSISNSKTLIIASIKGLPSKQFQEIKKSLRQLATVKVTKKNILIRAIENIGNQSILELEKYITSDSAFILSDIDGFELAGILSKKKTPIFAKAGQIAIEDIEVKEGPTELVPGPVISELGSLGLQIAVENGKITIKKSKIVIKKDQIINESAASLFQKLNIQPFKFGLNVSVIYDIKNAKIYKDIKIDPEFITNELKLANNKAISLAQKIVYYCNETIKYFLAKAKLQSDKLKNFIKE